ncbi:MAG: MBOAT family protein [Myxococcota bacterium]
MHELLAWHPAFSVLAILAVGVVAAVVVGPSPWRRRAAALLTLAALPWPFLAPAPVALRAALAFMAAWNFMRVVEVGARGAALPAWRRVAHVLMLFDTLATVRAPRRVDVGTLVSALLWTGVAAGGLWAALHLDPHASGYLPARWGLGALAFYAGFESMVGFTVATLRLLGLEPPVLHDRPILSTSIREFWGLRWNRVVHGWLKAFCFEPVRSRLGTGAGVLATFAFSALHHAYLVWPAQGVEMALCMAAFFAVQPVLLLVERGAGTRDWPVPLARVFTVAFIAASSPLIVEPVLRVLESAA